MIPLLDAQTYTITHVARPTYVDGLPVPGAASTSTIVASVQPMSGDELRRSTEGLSASHGIKFYASRANILRTVEADGPYADLILYNGRQYQIHRVQMYGVFAPLPHVRYEAYASQSGRAIPGQP